jgi:hypothetical protein
LFGQRDKKRQQQRQQQPATMILEHGICTALLPVAKGEGSAVRLAVVQRKGRAKSSSFGRAGPVITVIINVPKE